ncbi:PEP-CTERM sorting domain-containing protein [Candidatus Uabimicrobium amorphum]|uniref:Ice-binding protein C-terminal domain-containing protein n=1 Tax=Uabimicrobium amorphum TaxID=2596890 RepID=A0A5S9F4G4_UABAM|nr:PEP-CTERM sorting domain-containing protein [Candidatus Uabimicrobium amorphum]BBM85083.1 hypothetical protein UABAM_03446 [Candidatus Uabimicrobium amorphum]
MIKNLINLAIMVSITLYAETIKFQVDPSGGITYRDTNGNGSNLPNNTILNQLSIETGISGWDIEDTTASGNSIFSNNFVLSNGGAFITTNGVNFTSGVGFRVEATGLGTTNGALRISIASNATFNNSSLFMNQIDFTGITDDNLEDILQRAVEESATVISVFLVDNGTADFFIGINPGEIILDEITGLNTVPEPTTYLVFLMSAALLGLTRLRKKQIC